MQGGELGRAEAMTTTEWVEALAGCMGSGPTVGPGSPRETARRVFGYSRLWGDEGGRVWGGRGSVQ